MKRAVIIVALLTFARATAFASPNYVNFQARLTDMDGKALPAGTYKVELNFYDGPDSGNRLWGPYLMDDQTTLTGHAAKVTINSDGRFNVRIGPCDTASKFLLDAFNGASCYVDIRVQDGNPILPRQQFMSTPFAFRIPNVYPNGSNVGIGTDNPAYTLDVNGALKVTGTTSVTGQLIAANLAVSPFGSVTGIGSCPVGSIIAWHKSLTNVGTLPSNWVECNGQLIDDTGSPFDGKNAPNLNSAVRAGIKGRFLRGDTASGATQNDEVRTHNHTYLDFYFTGSDGRWGGGVAASGHPGTAGTQTLNSSADSSKNETRPFSFTVVWIIRVK